MDMLGLQAALQKAQAALDDQQTRIAALEGQIAKDANAIVDKVLAAILPEVQEIRGALNTAILTVDASVTEALAVIRRIDGAALTIKLGPESPQ